MPGETSYLQLVENFLNEKTSPICRIVANCHGKVGAASSAVDSGINPRLVCYQPKIRCCGCSRIIRHENIMFSFRVKLWLGDGGSAMRYWNLMRFVHGFCCMNMVASSEYVKCTDRNLDGDHAFLFSLIFFFWFSLLLQSFILVMAFAFILFSSAFFF